MSDLPDPEPTDPAEPRPPAEVIEVEARDVSREPDPAPESPTRAALAVVEPPVRPTYLVPGRDIPIIPEHREMQGMASMAVTLAGSGSVPEALRNHPNDVFQILLTARDLGVAVTTGMREFHVIKGRVTLSPKVKLAMVRERSHAEGWKLWPCAPQINLETGERKPCTACGSLTGNDRTRAAWHATRPDHPGSVFSYEFTWEQAKNVKDPGGKTLTEKDNYKNYPDRMLSWRAVGYLLDDVFPEVGTGLYSPDEMGAMTDEDGVAVIDVESTEPLPGTKAPKNHGPKGPDPRDALWSEDDPEGYAEFVARLDAVKAHHADAHAALAALWTRRPDDGGDPALPPKQHLQVRHQSKAKAMLASIEGRMAKGEWGDPPAADEQPPVEPQEPEGDEPAVAATDADEPSTDDQGPRCEACGVPEGSEHLKELHDMADTVDAARAQTSSAAVRDAQLAMETTDERHARITRETVAEVAKMEPTALLTHLSELLPEDTAMPRGKQDRVNLLADLLLEQRLAAPE